MFLPCLEAERIGEPHRFLNRSADARIGAYPQVKGFSMRYPSTALSQVGYLSARPLRDGLLPWSIPWRRLSGLR